jgi:hypothetical protein
MIEINIMEAKDIFKTKGDKNMLITNEKIDMMIKVEKINTANRIENNRLEREMIKKGFIKKQTKK